MKKINLISFLGLMTILINFISAHVGEDEFNHHGMMSGFYGMSFFGWFFMALIIVILILLIIWLINQIQESKRRTKHRRR